jgi:hypothetical protein
VCDCVINFHVEPLQTPVVEAQLVVGAPVVETLIVAKPVVLGEYYGGYYGDGYWDYYHHWHHHHHH